MIIWLAQPVNKLNISKHFAHMHGNPINCLQAEHTA